MIVAPFSYYNLALPDDLARWTVPAQGIRRWDEEALVYDVGYGGTIRVAVKIRVEYPHFPECTLNSAKNC